MKTTKYPIVLISWNDANFDFDPADPLDFTTTVGYTLGYLLKKTRKEVIVASELFSNGDIRQVTAIPRGMVRKIVTLRSFEL